MMWLLPCCNGEGKCEHRHKAAPLRRHKPSRPTQIPPLTIMEHLEVTPMPTAIRPITIIRTTGIPYMLIVPGVITVIHGRFTPGLLFTSAFRLFGGLIPFAGSIAFAGL